MAKQAVGCDRQVTPGRGRLVGWCVEEQAEQAVREHGMQARQARCCGQANGIIVSGDSGVSMEELRLTLARGQAVCIIGEPDRQVALGAQANSPYPSPPPQRERRDGQTNPVT